MELYNSQNPIDFNLLNSIHSASLLKNKNFNRRKQKNRKLEKFYSYNMNIEPTSYEFVLEAK